MCRTPHCFGDCDECIADAKREKEYEEANAECPYRTECNVKDINVKQDRCSTCGRVWNYS